MNMRLIYGFIVVFSFIFVSCSKQKEQAEDHATDAVRRQKPPEPSLGFMKHLGIKTVLPGFASVHAQNVDNQVRLEVRCGEQGASMKLADLDSQWFVFVESQERYWAFDGDRTVRLFEFKVSNIPEGLIKGFTVNDENLKEMPFEVQEEIKKRIIEQEDEAADGR